MRICREQALSTDRERIDRRLAFGRNDPIDEALPEIGFDVPLENVEAICDALVKYRSYYS